MCFLRVIINCVITAEMGHQRGDGCPLPSRHGIFYGSLYCMSQNNRAPPLNLGQNYCLRQSLPLNPNVLCFELLQYIRVLQ